MTNLPVLIVEKLSKRPVWETAVDRTPLVQRRNENKARRAQEARKRRWWLWRCKKKKPIEGLRDQETLQSSINKCKANPNRCCLTKNDVRLKGRRPPIIGENSRSIRPIASKLQPVWPELTECLRHFLNESSDLHKRRQCFPHPPFVSMEDASVSLAVRRYHQCSSKAVHEYAS